MPRFCLPAVPQNNVLEQHLLSVRHPASIYRSRSLLSGWSRARLLPLSATALLLLMCAMAGARAMRARKKYAMGARRAPLPACMNRSIMCDRME